MVINDLEFNYFLVVVDVVVFYKKSIKYIVFILLNFCHLFLMFWNFVLDLRDIENNVDQNQTP